MFRVSSRSAGGEKARDDSGGASTGSSSHVSGFTVSDNAGAANRRSSGSSRKQRFKTSSSSRAVPKQVDLAGSTDELLALPSDLEFAALEQQATPIATLGKSSRQVGTDRQSFSRLFHEKRSAGAPVAPEEITAVVILVLALLTSLGLSSASGRLMWLGVAGMTLIPFTIMAIVSGRRGIQRVSRITVGSLLIFYLLAAVQLVVFVDHSVSSRGSEREPREQGARSDPFPSSGGVRRGAVPPTTLNSEPAKSNPRPSAAPFTLSHAQVSQGRDGHLQLVCQCELQEMNISRTARYAWVVVLPTGEQIEHEFSISQLERPSALVMVPFEQCPRTNTRGMDDASGWTCYVAEIAAGGKHRIVSNKAPVRSVVLHPADTTPQESAPDAAPRGVASLRRQYGRDRVAVIYILGMAPKSLGVYRSRIRALVGNSQAAVIAQLSEDGRVLFGVAPCQNVGTLASSIHFGRVTIIDFRERRIVVDLRPKSERDQPLHKTPEDPGFYRERLALLRSSNPLHRLDGARDISKTPPKELRSEITEALKDVLDDTNFQTRVYALTALASWSREDIEPLALDAARDASDDVKKVAITILGKSKNPEAAEAVVACIGIFRLDGVARDALIQMGPVGRDAVVAHLDHLDLRGRRAALQVLQETGVPEEAVPVLGQLLRREHDFKCRDRLIDLLKTHESLKSLAALASALDGSGGTAVAKALQEIGPEAEPFVWPYLNRDSSSTVITALNVLKEIGTKKSVPYLLPLTEGHSNMVVNSYVYPVLIRLQDPRAIPVFLKTVADSTVLRNSAKAALVSFGPKAEDRVLETLASTTADRMRGDCLDILKEIGTRKTLPVLASYLAKKTGPLCRKAKEVKLAIEQRN